MKKKTLIVTVATLVVIVLAASAAVVALGALAVSHQTCGKVNPAELRKVGDPQYAAKLEKLARCGS